MTAIMAIMQCNRGRGERSDLEWERGHEDLDERRSILACFNPDGRRASKSSTHNYSLPSAAAAAERKAVCLAEQACLRVTFSSYLYLSLSLSLGTFSGARSKSRSAKDIL